MPHPQGGAPGPRRSRSAEATPEMPQTASSALEMIWSGKP